jgi:BirA family biotin operon repressor/biotin-[acetyl-CoA-carboxylase] ligase
LVRVRPSDPPAPTLALVAAVALHEVISDLTPDVRIKWPNDLLAGPAKLAGILLERSGDAVVIGFGANLAHHPEGLDRPVTDIAALTGATVPAATAAERLATRFAVWLGLWRSEGLAPIRAPGWPPPTRPELRSPRRKGRGHSRGWPRGGLAAPPSARRHAAPRPRGRRLPYLGRRSSK